jgi:hypothetical protein
MEIQVNLTLLITDYKINRTNQQALIIWWGLHPIDTHPERSLEVK